MPASVRRRAVLFFFAAMSSVAAQSIIAPQSQPADRPGIGVRLYFERAMLRAGRLETLCARLENPTDQPLKASVSLIASPEVRLKDAAVQSIDQWQRETVYLPGRKMPARHLTATIRWGMESPKPIEGEFHVIISGEGLTAVEAVLNARFVEAVDVQPGDYVPAPQQVSTGDYLIGSIYFPGYKPGTHYGWSLLEMFPERKPALGWYDEGDPEVSDWEIKYALEHGIQFFYYCWYRKPGTEGKPVQLNLGHAIHDGLFRSKFGDQFKFAIMWTNHGLGIASLDDLRDNLLPYWIENYFKRANYLKIDGKPLLGIYDMWRFIKETGGTPAKAAEATALIRQGIKQAGFPGVWIISEYRGNDPKVLQTMSACGMDASFAYCFHNVPGDAPDERKVSVVMDNLTQRMTWNILPNIPTIPVGWDPTAWETYTGYQKSPHFWFLPPAYKEVARRVKQMVDERRDKAGPLGRVILLDNWNEWGEGHFISPCRQYGFGYLDAIREVFGTPESTKQPHVDLLPEEVDRGPYEAAYHAWINEEKTKGK